MKRTLKIMLGIGVVAAMVALTIPQAHAQGGVACFPTKRMGAQQQANAAGRITIDTTTNNFPTAPLADGTIKGSFWVRGNPANNSGGPHFAGPNLCACETGQSWCKTGSGAVGANLGIIAQIGQAAPLCNQTLNCPNGEELVTVVEDINSTDTDAGFIMYIVEDFTQFTRAFDHSRTANPNPGNVSTQIMERFPTVDTQSSSGPPPNTTITSDYANVTINFHGVSGGAANTPRSPTQGIDSYDVCVFHGTSDPGRARGLWDCVVEGKSIAYTDPGPGSDLNDAFLVPCNAPNDPDNTFVAIGLTYVDGVESEYVGASTEVECNPAIADPDDIKRRPDSFDSRRRPVSRRGGR
jgi:hypothetical protein